MYLETREHGGKNMRHCYFRIVMSLIWMVCAVVCTVNGNDSMAVLYGGVGIVFGYTAYEIWKKEKTGRK